MLSKIMRFKILGFIVISSLPLAADDIKNNTHYHAAQTFIKRYSCNDIESCNKMFMVENLVESQEYSRDNKIIKEFFAEVRAGDTAANDALDYCRTELSNKIKALSNKSTRQTWAERVRAWSPWVVGIVALNYALQFQNVPVGFVSIAALGYGANETVKNLQKEVLCLAAQQKMQSYIHILNLQQLTPLPLSQKNNS